MATGGSVLHTGCLFVRHPGEGTGRVHWVLGCIAQSECLPIACCLATLLGDGGTGVSQTTWLFRVGFRVCRRGLFCLVCQLMGFSDIISSGQSILGK